MQVTFILAFLSVIEFCIAGKNGGNGKPQQNNGKPPKPDGGKKPKPALRVKCSKTPEFPPEIAVAYNPRDACDLTEEFESFAAGYEKQEVCDGLFTGKDEEALKLFCNVIKQTVDEFQTAFATAEDPDYWCNPRNIFPGICDGRSPTVCSVCTTIQSEYLDTSCNPDWDALTRAVAALFPVQPVCEIAIDDKKGREYEYGLFFCNYVLKINDDFGCQEWADIVTSCGDSVTELECFQQNLFSTLIQTSGYVLHESEVCIKTLEDSARLLV